MPSPIAATALLEPILRHPIPPKAAARFAARAFRALFRFQTRTVRKPPAVAALGTIKASSSRGNRAKSELAQSELLSCGAKRTNKPATPAFGYPAKDQRELAAE